MCFIKKEAQGPTWAQLICGSELAGPIGFVGPGQPVENTTGNVTATLLMVKL